MHCEGLLDGRQHFPQKCLLMCRQPVKQQWFRDGYLPSKRISLNRRIVRLGFIDTEITTMRLPLCFISPRWIQSYDVCNLRKPKGDEDGFHFIYISLFPFVLINDSMKSRLTNRKAVKKFISPPTSLFPFRVHGAHFSLLFRGKKRNN